MFSKKGFILKVVFFVLFISFTCSASTDTKGRGKLYQLMIKNIVEFQKVIVAMSQNRWDAAIKEIAKQKTFAENLLKLYPKKTIEDIRHYKKIVRQITPHVEKFQKNARKGNEIRAQREFCSIFSLCLSCHSKFRD